jgi:hypothetical protein
VNRGASSGKFRKAGYIDAVDVVSGCHLPNQKDYSMLHHPDSNRDWRPAPIDGSQGPSIAESLHLSHCPGGNLCAAPSFHAGLEDGQR